MSESVKMQGRVHELRMLQRELAEVKRTQRLVAYMVAVVIALSLFTALFASDTSMHVHEQLPHTQSATQGE